LFILFINFPVMNIKKVLITKKSFLLFLLFLIFLSSNFTACRSFSLNDIESPESEDNLTGKNADSDSEQPVVAAASIIPVGEFIREIGGKRVDVIVMVPPGAEPHVYEPTPRQLVELSRAKIYVKLGSGIDFELGLMDKIAEINKKMMFVNCSDGIEMLDDPHIWVSLKNAKIIIENIYRGFAELDPENISMYTENKDIFLEKIEKLDKEISEMLKDKKNRKFMVYHPAWTYFASDYNLEQIPIEYEGKEPTIKNIENLIEEARKNNIRVILASPQFSTKSAEVISDEIDAEVVLIDPLASNYIDNIKTVAKVLDTYLE